MRNLPKSQHVFLGTALEKEIRMAQMKIGQDFFAVEAVACE